MPQGYELLATTRLTTIMQVMVDQLAPVNALAFLRQTPVTPAMDGEIMGLYEGNVVSADIVPDDQAAVVASAGRVALNQQAIPNLKKGSQVTQEMWNLLRRINRGGGIPGDQGLFSDYVRNEVAARLAGVRILMNRMIAGMHMDLFSYRKNGVIYDNVTWGMPSIQKFVPATPWTNTASTPVDDLLLWQRASAENFPYETYNYIRLSRALFHSIVLTTNFKDYAKLYNTAFSFTSAFPSDNIQALAPLFKAATNLDVRFEDATYRDELDDGSVVSYRYQPSNIATLGDSADDNDPTQMDFANAVVNETEMGDVPGTTVVGGGFLTPQTGPVAYATIKGDLNPPNVTLWGVARGFPRKKNRYATARVTAYPAAEAVPQIPAGLPF